jgi:hypothetical protein
MTPGKWCQTLKANAFRSAAGVRRVSVLTARQR